MSELIVRLSRCTISIRTPGRIGSTSLLMMTSKMDTSRLLPSESDYDEMTKNLSILVARILKQYAPFFEKFGSGLERHIRHKFYEQMDQKSEIVSLLIILPCNVHRPLPGLNTIIVV